MINLMK